MPPNGLLDFQRAKLLPPYFLGYGCDYYGCIGMYIHTYKYTFRNETKITALSSHPALNIHCFP